MNKDNYGVLGQIQSDGSIESGDAANWHGHYIYLTNSDFDYTGFFEVKPGSYVRHPDPAMTFNSFGAFYNNPYDGCISRDQLTGILAALIKQKKRKAILMLIMHHAAWLFLFSYNTRKNGHAPSSVPWKWPDATLFDIWALELRGFGLLSWVFWPVLCVLDLHLLIGAIAHEFKGDPDVISFLMKHFISRDYVPTPTSWLTHRLISRDRMFKKLKQYWAGWRKQPEMVELYMGQLWKR